MLDNESDMNGEPLWYVGDIYEVEDNKYLSYYELGLIGDIKFAIDKGYEGVKFTVVG